MITLLLFSTWYSSIVVLLGCCLACAAPRYHPRFHTWPSQTRPAAWSASSSFSSPATINIFLLIILSGENIVPSPYTPAWTRPYCWPSWGWTGRLELQGPTPARSSTGTTPASADVPPAKEHICKICKRITPVKLCKICKNLRMRVEIRQTGIFSASSSVFTIHWHHDLHHDLHHCLYLSNLSPAFDHDKLVELLLVDSLEPPLSSQQRLHNNRLWNKQQHSYKIFKISKVYIGFQWSQQVHC